MRYGLALPHYDFSFPDHEPVTFDRVAEFARTAEGLGFHSVWISDHFFLSLERYGGSDELLGSLEPFTTLAALSQATERIRLGTLVACAPFRHPGILAKQATALDLLSEGRLDLGIGAGWYEDEFRAFGYPFGTTGERFELLEETLGVLGQLFRDGPADHDGRHFRLRGAYNHPVPAQSPRPPVWLGSKGGDRSLRLAARYADGWNTVWRWEPSAYAERVAAARRACEAEGRDPSTLRLSVGLYALVGEDDADLRARFRQLQAWTPGGALDGQSLQEFTTGAFVGTPERLRELGQEFADQGVEEIILSPASLPFAFFDPSMLELASATLVAPS
ncbi:MAG: LLM class flavin-dependent oxidoreductase [Actinomycetota bacterium]|nr:LLM class flavin-dependent oxidoreductase [Actinomycetota bacterium]